MLKKVLFIGCSFTYGQELSQRLEQSYPSILGKINNWEVVNRGMPGASNDRIIRILIDEIDKKYDLIIIAWTELARKEVYDTNHKRLKDVSPTNIKDIEWLKYYYAFGYDRVHAYSNWLLQLILVQSLLKQHDQDYIFCNTFNNFEGNLSHSTTLLKKVDTTKFVDWPNSMIEWIKDLPIGPNYHPLEEGHQAIADKINNHLTK